MSEGKIVGGTVATILAIAGSIVACILIFFGVLFIWGAFSPQGNPGWITIGTIIVGVGLAIIAFAVGLFVYTRRQAQQAQQPQEIVQKIDLSGDIALDKMKCQNCGAELDKDSITVREGAIFVSCPYCGTSYQMIEEPKW